MLSNVYWLRPTIAAKGRVVSQLGLGTRLMWIISSNWLTVVKIARRIYRYYVGKSVIEPKVAIVMQQDVRSAALVGIWQDGSRAVDYVMDFEDGGGSTAA